MRSKVFNKEYLHNTNRVDKETLTITMQLATSI